MRLTNSIIMDHVKIQDKVRARASRKAACLHLPRSRADVLSAMMLCLQVSIVNSIVCSSAEICEGASLKDAQVCSRPAHTS